MSIPENPRKSVLAAFDSVNLINQMIVNTGSTIENKIDIITRNYKHLEIMMLKDWFIGSLEGTEGNQIQTCITEAKNFIDSNE